MDAVQEVKARLSIEDVISEYVQLKRAGRNFKGLSPFSNEKTPSFIVSPEKQIWHDFSSGKGGDVFSFIMEVEGVDFKGALDLLARKAGINLDEYQTSRGKSGVDKNRLHQAVELAVKFYQVQLKANQEALDYVTKARKFNRQTIMDFGIGYSPNTGNALVEFLLKKGFSEYELKTAGLSALRRGVQADMFRGRIMVTLHDGFGKPVGFTARLLESNDNAPKYINTPSTPLYDKSHHVYGLHLAKKDIRDSGFAVIVEGNLDVIASHQAGQKNVVATAGTAMTEYQLKSLSRLAPSVRLAFDQDQAGLAATERAIPIASKVGLNLEIITIPSGKDPDELIQKDPKLWADAINNAQPAFDWLLARYKDKLDLNTAAGKRTFSDVLLAVVRQLGDQVEKDHYLQQISEVGGIGIDALQEKLSENKTQSPKLKYIKSSQTSKEIEADSKDRQKATDALLCLALMLPGTRGYLDLVQPEMLISDPSRTVLDFLKENPDFDGDMKSANSLRKVADYVKILSLQFEELYGNVDTLELQYEAARLRAKIIEYFIKQQKRLLSAELDGSTGKAEQTLLERVRELDKLLKDIKE